MQCPRSLWWFGLVYIVLSGAPAHAQDANEPTGLFETYTVTALGTTEQAWLRVGTEYDRGEVGLFATYLEDVAGDEADETYGAGVYGTFEIAAGTLEPVGLPTTPTSAYLLSKIGVLEGSKPDVVCALGAGVKLGAIVVEWNWLPDADLWSSLPDWDDSKHKLLIGAQVRF